MSSFTFTQLREKTQKTARTAKSRKKKVFLSTITAATFCMNEPPLPFSILRPLVKRVLPRHPTYSILTPGRPGVNAHIL